MMYTLCPHRIHIIALFALRNFTMIFDFRYISLQRYVYFRICLSYTITTTYRNKVLRTPEKYNAHTRCTPYFGTRPFY